MTSFSPVLCPLRIRTFSTAHRQRRQPTHKMKTTKRDEGVFQRTSVSESLSTSQMLTLCETRTWSWSISWRRSYSLARRAPVDQTLNSGCSQRARPNRKLQSQRFFVTFFLTYSLKLRGSRKCLSTARPGDLNALPLRDPLTCRAAPPDCLFSNQVEGCHLSPTNTLH